MKTFKQFIVKNALERLHPGLFLQRQFDLSKKEQVGVADWMDSDISNFDERSVWHKTHNHYNVAKGEAPDLETKQWIMDHGS